MKTTDLQSVIFDFDYTLADSSPGVFECINFALREMGLDHVSQEAACRTIGLSLNETFLTLGKHHEPHRCDEFHQLFVQRADQVMVDRTALYETVPTMVNALRARGLRLGIVSTKYRSRINGVLKRDGLIDQFGVVIGGDDVEHYKPHPQGLFEAMKKLESSPENVVYVGDSQVDAELAKRAGVPLIIVLSGVTPKEHFDNYTPVGVLENISHLPQFLF